MSKPIEISDIPKSVWERQFNRSARSPRIWQWKSLQLKRSADLVYTTAEAARKRQVEMISEEIALGSLQDGARPMSDEESSLSLDSSLFGVYFMLMGFAIENLVKGIGVARDQNCINDKGKFKYGDHRLIQLFEMFGIPLTSAEKDSLQNLTDHSIWIGRYPIPMDASRLYPRRAESEERCILPGQWAGEGEYKILNSLYARLWWLLEEVIQTSR